MKENDYTLIEQYFEGALNADQQTAFQARLAEDKVFAEEFELRQRMQTYLKTLPQKEKLTQQLEKIGADYFQEEEQAKVVPIAKKKTTYRWLALATAAAVTLLLILWNPFQQADLYPQYAMHETLSLTEKSGDVAALATAAERAFNQKEYAQAKSALDAYLQENPDDVKALLYKAIAMMELDELEESRAILKPIAAGNSARNIEAKWYMALSYLKSGTIEKVKTTLQEIPESETYWYTKAQKLLKDLN